MNIFNKKAILTALLLAAGQSGIATADLSQTAKFDIPPQTLQEALIKYSSQSQVQVTGAAEIIDGKASPGVAGSLQARSALARLLEGTDLTYDVINENTVIIRRVVDLGEVVPTKAGMGVGGVVGGARLAQADASSLSQGENGGQRQEVKEDDSAASLEEAVAEVVVTGTHIRGVEHPVGGQLISISEDEIQKSGFMSVQDVVRSLPQNFGGGISEDTIDLRIFSPERGTALNLRGLGVGTTLTLLNGRRMAAGGTTGGFTDVSSIPLSAIEKVEVLPDGASALYGSDAIGGVVNIMLKKEFSGADTLAQIGSVTEGPLKDIRIGQNLGTSWKRGSVLASMEYRHRDALPASAREEMDSDLRRFGGADLRSTFCNPGTIVSGGESYSIPTGQNGASLAPSSFTPGTASLCNRSTGTVLLSEEKRWNFLGMARHEVSDALEVFADASYANRNVVSPGSRVESILVPSSNAFYVNPAGGSEPIIVQYNFSEDLPTWSEFEGRFLNVALGGKLQLRNNWQAVLDTGESRQKYNSDGFSGPDAVVFAAALADPDPATAFNPFADGAHTNPATLAALRGSRRQEYETDSKLSLSTLVIDGPIFSTPAGDAKLALGGERRSQSLDVQSSIVSQTVPTPIVFPLSDFERHVKAGFAELFIPLIGRHNRRAGVEALDISIAGRYENYNDFGDAVVPRFGLRWTSFSNMTFRGTWSRSFRAPQATDLLLASNQWGIFDLLSPTEAGVAAVLYTDGGNADLKEETAKIWTFGIDWSPALFKSLTFGINYFDIDFVDRIDAVRSFDLSDPVIQAVLTPNPTTDQREIACNAPLNFGNSSDVAPGDCLTAPVDFLMDFRVRNLASVRERGIDFLGSYQLVTTQGDLLFNLNASYVFDYKQALTDSAPEFDIIDTANNPLAFKLRGSIAWSLAGFDATLFMDHAGRYRYSLNQPDRKVGSWTTFSLNLSYEFGVASNPVLDDLQVSVNVQNLFDKRSPVYLNPAGNSYDPANADLLRRFVSIAVRKRW